MKVSAYFGDLASSYAYEIEDLTWDSGGDNVLITRLKAKRGQFADLLPMCAFDPVMVAPAFHRAFRFGAREVFDRLVGTGPDAFPSWGELAAAMDIEPWAAELVAAALATPEGEQFLIVATGLEYMHGGHAQPASADDAEASGEDDKRDEEEDEDQDLAEAGEDYLSEQGFDRRG